MDPSIYLVDDENKSSSGVQAENKEINPASAELDNNTAVHTQNIHVDSGGEKNNDSKILSSNDGVSDDQVGAVSNSMSSLGLIGSLTGHKGLSLLVLCDFRQKEKK